MARGVEGDGGEPSQGWTDASRRRTGSEERNTDDSVRMWNVVYEIMQR